MVIYMLLIKKVKGMLWRISTRVNLRKYLRIFFLTDFTTNDNESSTYNTQIARELGNFTAEV
jgi:hypothetical protein